MPASTSTPTTTLQLSTVKLEGPFESVGMAMGTGRLALEVVFARHSRVPANSQLQSTWKKRLDGRGVPLLLIVEHANKAYVCGPSGDRPQIYEGLDLGQVERICSEALGQPDRHAAQKSLRDSLGTLEDGTLAGLRNEGFLAAHELNTGVPQRSDWASATTKGSGVLRRTGTELLTGLGFTVDRLDNLTSILKIGSNKSGVAVLLDADETPEAGSGRFPGNLSPVSYALTRADEEGLDWVILTHGRKIRLYPVRLGVGVGRRGRTETWIECHTALLEDDMAAYLWLLFSAEALKDGGSLEGILSASLDFAGELATQLRERIYNSVIPLLAEGLAEARNLKKPTSGDLAVTYQMAMRILFRILFIAYGEDKDLLPYRYNNLYEKRSLKTKARELQQLCKQDDGVQFDEGDTLWQELHSLFKAVDKGNSSWGVPAYNGGLFASDADTSTIGAALADVSLPDSVFGPAMINLLLVPTHEGVLGPVDFRALGVREFGTIYEGLLESELSIAEQDLAVETRGKNKDAYRPAKKGEDVVVSKGTAYLHNASGARKSSGSYYTKSFAVEHLLDRALEPAIADHFDRLNELDELEAGEQFFDFRVADIAMGSAHFLVAAIDRIEVRFSGYLAKRPLPLVAQELDHLRSAAKTALGDTHSSYGDIEDTMLLRRQIARRCIYGVDINEVAVQLARLAIWVHTFVPGLPLSLLDRTLVHGNSLVGIGTLDEIETKIREDNDMPLWHLDQESFIGDASETLDRMAKIADANKAELAEAKKAWTEAKAAIAPARAVCDILTAARIEDEPFPLFVDEDWEELKSAVEGRLEHAHARAVLKGLSPLHFPIAFPEVFLRERSGFDVILGNPPWEEVTLEQDSFWGRHRAGGLRRTLSQREQERVIEEFRRSRPELVHEYEAELAFLSGLRASLLRGPFPGMGTGDPDLYKAFSWRFLSLSSPQGGRVAVVLPRTSLTTKGSSEYRKQLFLSTTDLEIVTLVNRKRWVFDEGHPQQTYGLLNFARKDNSANDQVCLSGPFACLAEFESSVRSQECIVLLSDLLRWSDTASLPLLPNSESINVFTQLRQSPRLDLDQPDEWRVRPYTELHATNDKKNKKTGEALMDLESKKCPEGFWPVYKGESFDIWEPDTGRYYAWGDPEKLMPRLQAKRERGMRTSSSVFSECDPVWCLNPDTLPCLHPKIAFRDITQWDNTRTVIPALLPPNVFVTNKGPYLVFIRGDQASAAYLLGILSSLPLDWYARCFVETSLNFYLLNPFPIPRPVATSSLRERVVAIASRLACPDDRFADWAVEVGVECGPLEEDTKQDMIHELDAVVAHLYGLTESHLVHIFESFHVGWDYQDRLDATLKHYAAWEGKA